MSARGSVVSVNASGVRAVLHRGETVATGIFKTPVEGRVPLRGVNLRGDDQADRSAHGGPDRVLYAYAGEDYDWWRLELGRDVPAGKFGDNLTLRGIDVSGALIGEQWRIGSVVLRVTSPRVPCFKLAMTMEDPHFVRRFAQALRPGAYLALDAEGDIAAGDTIEVVSRPDHRLSVAAMAKIFLFERGRAAEMLQAPELPEEWRRWAGHG